MPDFVDIIDPKFLRLITVLTFKFKSKGGGKCNVRIDYKCKIACNFSFSTGAVLYSLWMFGRQWADGLNANLSNKSALDGLIA